eukprot:3226428-Prymnesium_polylepis.1
MARLAEHASAAAQIADNVGPSRAGDSHHQRLRGGARAARRVLVGDHPGADGGPVFCHRWAHVREVRHIERWFEKKHTSPKTGEVLVTTVVFPNNVMRRQIIEWCEAHPPSAP